MTCHSTGMDVVPNVTAQRAVPRTGMGELLYGFNFTLASDQVGSIFVPEQFHIRRPWHLCLLKANPNNC